MSALTRAAAFFRAHAGYSYNPQTETRAQGRMRCAMQLACSEALAADADISFSWSEDDTDSSEWSDERPSWSQWVCAAMRANGDIVASLGGVDFGRDGEPWSHPYKRVVEAELAHDALRAIGA